MALVLKDRVKETTTTTGTGSFSLAGAVTGYDSFGQIGTGNTTYYAVYLDGGSEWEVGIGTYTAPSTLSRDTILASSNSGSVVTFSAGQKTIWCDYPAGKAVYLDASGSISEPIVNISGLSGAISTVDTIAFDTTYATTLTAGQIGWNGNNTLGLGMIGGNVIQHIGEDTFFYVKASAAITKGQLCMFTGAVGSSGVLTAAPATAIPFAEAIIGVAAEDIANNAFGLIQNTGTLKGVNTSAFLDGDILYYNSAVTGGFTKTYPASGPVVIAAAVAKSGSGGSGILTIRISFQTRVTGSTGLSVVQGNDTVALTNTGVTSAVAGTGISVSGATGAVTITNTGVTSVTGTSPVVSSGGTTPAISMPAATSSVNGYLTSTDWTTFNNKGNGTVTSVSGTGTVSGISLSGTVTSSGSLSLGGALDLSSPPAIGNTTPNTVAATTITASTSIMPAADNTGVIGDATTTWSNGQFTSLTIDSTLNVRAAIDLADSDVLRMGSSDDWQIFYNGTTNKANVELESACLAISYTDNGTEIASLEKSTGTYTAKQLSASNGLVVNSNTVSASYSIPSGSSATSAGPMTIASGVTVTVPSGSRWVVL